MENKTLLVHGAIFTVALIYAANYSIMKTVTPEFIQPLGLVIVRVFSAAALFWIITPKEYIDKKDYLKLATCALFGIALNQMFFIKGLSLTVPLNASVIMTSTPIMVLIVSSIILKEKITFLKTLGILLGFAGAFLLFTDGGKKFEGANFWGDIFIFINALSYGIYLVLVKPLMEKYSPLTVVKWLFTFGCVFVFPFGIQDFLTVDWTAFSRNGYLSIAYIVVCTTFMTYLLNGWALKHVSPNVVGYYIYLQPILATSIAIYFRGDPLRFQSILFSCLIFIGVFLVSIKIKEKKIQEG